MDKVGASGVKCLILFCLLQKKKTGERNEISRAAAEQQTAFHQTPTSPWLAAEPELHLHKGGCFGWVGLEDQAGFHSFSKCNSNVKWLLHWSLSTPSLVSTHTGISLSLFLFPVWLQKKEAIFCKWLPVFSTYLLICPTPRNPVWSSSRCSQQP